jgi:peptidoglycan/xylan/chitin deacetylase (PgdA/CDA1 family)
VLEYHDTEYKMKRTIQMKTAWFLDQMEWLDENGFETLSGEQLRRFARGEYRPPQRSVVLRFDIGLPALENYRDDHPP